MKYNLDEDIMTTNNKNNNPQTPLIKLKNENEDISGEDLQNSTDKYEKEKSEESPKFVPRKKSKKKWLKYLLIIFMIASNFFPFVNSIIEIILREVNKFEFNGFLVPEIIFNVIILVCLIKATCHLNEINCELCIGCIILLILIIIFSFEIIRYFIGSNHGIEYSDKFMNFFIKFRLIVFLIVIVNDIIFSIICYNIYYKGEFFIF